MGNEHSSAGAEARQLAEKMQLLQKTYREKILRATTELAEIKAQYESECKQLMRAGIQDAEISLGDVEGQSAGPGGSLLAPCTACSIACATDI